MHLNLHPFSVLEAGVFTFVLAASKQTRSTKLMHTFSPPPPLVLPFVYTHSSPASRSTDRAPPLTTSSERRRSERDAAVGPLLADAGGTCAKV